jgi:hypothetical protein
MDICVSLGRFVYSCLSRADARDEGLNVDGLVLQSKINCYCSVSVVNKSSLSYNYIKGL